MKILVTGAAGNLGRALLQKCRDRHEVVATDIVTLPEDLAGEGHVTFKQGDTFDPAFFREVATGCDAICHAAALHGGNVKTHSHQQFIQANVGGADMICQTMLDLGIERIAFSSTSQVTVGRGGDMSGASIITDQTPPRPDTIYSLSKFMAEQVYDHFARIHGLRVSCLRYCGFGYWGRTPLGTSLVSRYLESIDIAEANLRCIECDAIRSEMFYVGPINPLTTSDMVKACVEPETVLEKYWPGSVDLLKKAGRPMDDPLWPKLEVTRLCQVTGWRPEYTFEILLEELKTNPR